MKTTSWIARKTLRDINCICVNKVDVLDVWHIEVCTLYIHIQTVLLFFGHRRACASLNRMEDNK